MNEDKARAILISKLGGSKDKGISLLEIAKAVKFFKDQNKSYKDIAKEFDISPSIIGSFYKMNKHPEEIKTLINDKKIGLDTSTKLFTIEDGKKRIEFAKIVAGLPAMESRYIIDYYKRAPELSAKKCREFVMKSKTKTREIHMLVVPLEDTEFSLLEKNAKKAKKTVDQFAKKCILDKIGD